MGRTTDNAFPSGGCVLARFPKTSLVSTDLQNDLLTLVESPNLQKMWIHSVKWIHKEYENASGTAEI